MNIYNIFKYPNQISFLSYDLTGLLYYLLFDNNFIADNENIL